MRKLNNRTKMIGVMALLAIGILLLSGCINMREEITLKPDENWEAYIEITVPAATVQMVGEEQLKSSQADWEKQQKEYEGQGVKAKLDSKKESNGDYVYSVTMSGKGYDLLNQTSFGGDATIKTLENGHIQFKLDPGAGDMTSLTQMGGSLTFVLKAGKVHSANGTIKGGTVTWENPTTPLEAEVSPGGGGGGGSTVLIVVLVLLALVVLVVVVVVLLYMRGKKKQQPPAAMPPMAPPPPTTPPPTA